MIKTSGTWLLTSMFAVLSFAASARADLTYVCDAGLTDATTAESAQIALSVRNEQSGHPAWELMRKGQKFKGRKWIRALSNGYQVKVQGKGAAEKASMTYIFNEGDGMCSKPSVRGSVQVTWAADGQSKVVETRPCLCRKK